MKSNQIFTIQKLFIAFNMFSFSMILPYFMRTFEFKHIINGFLIFFSMTILMIVFLRRLMTKEFMMITFISRVFALGIFFVKPTLFWLYTFYFVMGLGAFFFWIPYNIRYFLLSNKMNRATSAGHFIIVGPILSSFVPLISAFVILNLGYKFLAGIGLILAFVLIKKASKIPKLDVRYNIFEDFSKAKGLRSLKFLQGFWEAGYISIGLFTLAFIQGEAAFGGFLSYLGLIGVIATLFVTKFSDKQQKRLKFFFPLLVFLTIFTISLAFADTFLKWAAFAALIGMTSTLAYPFFFAVVLDKIEDKGVAMIIRELMLNIGRVIGFLVMIAMFNYEFEFRYVFIPVGLALFGYILLLFKKNVYVEEAYYPLGPVAKVYDSSKNIVMQVYAWGKVDRIVEESKIASARLYDGTKWITVSAKKLGDRALNKLARGKTSYIFRRMKKN